MGKPLIIANINQKGGACKTTDTVNTAYTIAVNENKRVLVIDVDPQGNSSSCFYTPPEVSRPAPPNDMSLVEQLVWESEWYDSYLEENPHLRPKNACDLYRSKKTDIRECIYPAIVDGQEVKNLSVIPSNIHLAVIAEQVTVQHHRERILTNHIKRIENDYDIIFIDCPPTLGILSSTAIYSADFILIPTTYDKNSLNGIADLFRTIMSVKETSGFRFGILRNARDIRNKQTNEFIEGELSRFENNLFKTIIRRSESINQAQCSDEPILSFDPKSVGAEDFISFSKELLQWLK